jgi:5'-deoxynucleotidase YfbR-like HD superfamily hydrolase
MRLKDIGGAAGLLASAALALSACGEDRSVEAYCQSVEEAEAIENQVSDLDPNDVEGAREAFSQARDEIGAISESAPEEIRADVEEFESAFDELADALEDVDSPEALGQELADFQERFAGAGEASMRIAAFTDENCEEGAGEGE